MTRRQSNYGYRARGRVRNRSKNPGMERARQHIAEAEALTKELGGTDKDVKEYFFSLSAGDIKPILDEYGRLYGSSARDYAEKTIPNWRIGRTHMSGMVAERLFGLLPPKMPLAKKYELVENLWTHLGPKSNTTFTVGYNTSIEDILSTITSHSEKVITDFQMPENLENRFKWISSGDVKTKQNILNHLQKMERKTVFDGVQMQVPVLQSHLSSPNGQYSKSATQAFQVGSHYIRLEFEASAEGVSIGSIRTNPSLDPDGSSVSGLGWVLWVLGAIALFLIFGG
ncbi:hypothetical protein [Sulfitobacter sp. BSw21498]|uniref:hypothetical protein n=1 Tax=Sulfitobacter sp. BSw21498 TaxID=664426 RepID=UPI00111068BD|nr:hypothetical protein [Sulfitobacter sp. BSw21498]